LKADPGSAPGSNVAAAVFRFSESGATRMHMRAMLAYCSPVPLALRAEGASTGGTRAVRVTAPGPAGHGVRSEA
jgi:hypothetical protein